jgi:hypothetical protein
MIGYLKQYTPNKKSKVQNIMKPNYWRGPASEEEEEGTPLEESSYRRTGLGIGQFVILD